MLLLILTLKISQLKVRKKFETKKKKKLIKLAHSKK